MLRLIINSITIISLGIVLASCEEVIDIDLNSEAPQTVIEGSLRAGEDSINVRISQTADYFNSDANQTISNATVVLIDEEGEETMLSYTGNGYYRAEVTPVVNTRYTLKVDIDGQLYEASSFLPDVVEITGLELEYQSGGGPIDPGFQLFTNFVDDGNTTNYYRVKHSVNGNLRNTGDDLLVYDDRLFDGAEARLPLFQKVFNEGEELEIELIHFDEESYRYFNSLADIIADQQGPNGGTAAPGNPVTNWSNGALGYFSASSSDTKTIVVQ